MGIVFQFFNLIPILTVAENFALPYSLKGKSEREITARVQALLSDVDLLGRLDHYPHEISGGELQRVAIARALVKDPSIVLADELTGDLDTKTGEKVMNYLKSINKLEKQTVIVVTHDLNIANKTDKIYQILDGKIINE